MFRFMDAILLYPINSLVYSFFWAFFVYLFVVSTILKVDKLNYWCLHASQGYGMRARVCVWLYILFLQ